MRVCFFISGFDYSGAEIVLDRYIKGNKSIEPYFIIIYNNEKVLSKYIKLYGKEVVFTLNLKHNKNILRFLPWIDIRKIVNAANNIIKKINPQVLYMNNTHEMMLCKKVVEDTNIKSIAHIHDMRKSIGSPIKRLCMDNAIKLYDEVLTVSQATKNEWGSEKIKVVYNGIDREFFVNEGMYKTRINTIGFIGKISSRKGFDLLYQVYKNNDNIQKLELFLGYASVEEKLNKELEDLLKFKNVKSFCKMNYEQIKKFYDEIDLLIVPSIADPLPTVVIEAMARGCIVIGSNVDGIPELLGDKRLLFNVGDSIALKNKILEITAIKEDEIIELSKQLKFRCINKFLHDKKKEKINTIIANL